MHQPSVAAQDSTHRFPTLIISLLLSCSLLLIGCVSPNSPSYSARAEKLQPGMTTVELHKHLGKPDVQQTLPDGQTLQLYYHWQKDPRQIDGESGYDGPTSLQLLSLLLDDRHKLTKHLVSSGGIIGNQRSRGGPEAGTIVQEFAPQSITPLQTTFTELVSRYGHPTAQSLAAGGLTTGHWFFISTRPNGQYSCQELLVTFDTANKVQTVNVNLNPPVPANLFSAAPIKTLQPDFQNRQVKPPEVPRFGL